MEITINIMKLMIATKKVIMLMEIKESYGDVCDVRVRVH
jgi:hypothetical protein